jgi:D-glycero-alpha-D-manno-heptose-7-phosphate kinase
MINSNETTFRARAPLRLGLAGGGTDVSPYLDDFGGLVLNVTINKYAYATLEPRSDGKVELRNADSRDCWLGDAAQTLPIVKGVELHAGVYNRIVKDFCGGRPCPITITSHSEAPPGSGLGSSSTMVVALVKAFAEMLSLPLGDYEVARLAYSIERTDLGMAGGKQDQYAAAFGGLNFIEFYANDRVIVNPLRLKPHYRAELEASLVLYFTGVSRKSEEIVKQQVSNMKSKSASSMDALHALKRDAIQMKEAVLLGDLENIAASMRHSWEAKKATAASVSNPMIDGIFDSAIASGALAGKVSGAGGGGFMMFIVEPTKRANVIAKLGEFSGQVMLGGFVEYGAHAWRA